MAVMVNDSLSERVKKLLIFLVSHFNTTFDFSAKPQKLLKKS